MAQRTFPVGIRPTSRSYIPGEYPQTTFQAQNGAKTVLRYGNKRYDSTMKVEFKNITDDQAAQILVNYENINSDWDYLDFNGTNVLDGLVEGGSANHSLSTYVREAISGLRWRYAKPPSLSSGAYPGVSNVSCSFVACMDGT
tara:strand:+ start:218 stop:643 length:426 start_codon:yes stop_codon:yes gene_type:complete